MKELIEALGVWGVPTCVLIGLFIIFVFMQITGEIIEWRGKVAPEILKIRKFFKRKREEKKRQKQLLENVERLLSDVNKHYNTDNITQRNHWMSSVNSSINNLEEKVTHYDESIRKLTQDFNLTANAINLNTELTEEIFVQSSRDRIIDFAARAGDYDLIISREEFNRVFKVYQRYEDFLRSHGRENGEIETNYSIIQDGYDYRVRHHCFLEDVRSNLKK